MLSGFLKINSTFLSQHALRRMFCPQCHLQDLEEPEDMFGCPDERKKYFAIVARRVFYYKVYLKFCKISESLVGHTLQMN